MKRLYILFLLCLTFHSVKADWDLFPLNQKSYYSIPYSGYERINLVAFDSVVQRSGFESTFPNRKSSGYEYGLCYDEVVDYSLVYWYWLNNEFDSLVYSGDTIIFSPELYFLPLKNLGESWRISGPSRNGFTDIEFTCTSISVQSFLGVTDSVKEFTLSTYDGANLYNSPLSGFVIRLSKTYGLLDYLEFLNLQYHNKEEHHLIGLNDSLGNYGFQAPTYLDFFPYKVGDILNWLTESHPYFPYPSTYHYFRDSIISVTITTDSLMYQSIRQHFQLPTGTHWTDTVTEILSVDYYKSILEAPTNWFSITERSNFSFNDIAFTESLLREQDSSISYKINYGGASVDTSNCQIYEAFDVAYHYVYNSKQGHIEYCDDAFYYSCTKRIGSFMDGVLYGDTLLETRIASIEKSSLINVYPNPAQKSFYLDIEKPGGTLHIVSLLGEIVKEIIIRDLRTEVDIEDLEAGAYLVRFTDNFNQQSVKRIVRIN